MAKTDWIEAAAAASVEMATKAMTGIDGDPGLKALCRELEKLPAWKEDASGWRKGIGQIWDMHRLPSAADLEARSDAERLLLRTCSMAYYVAASRDNRMRPAYLVMAATASGALMHLALGVAGVEETIAVKVAAQNRKNAGERKSVKAMKEVRQVFEEWQSGKRKSEWHTFREFGKWANREYGVSAENVARQAGIWNKEKRWLK